MAALLLCADLPRSPLQSRLALDPKASARTVCHRAHAGGAVVADRFHLRLLPPTANPHEQFGLAERPQSAAPFDFPQCAGLGARERIGVRAALVLQDSGAVDAREEPRDARPGSQTD